MEVRWLGAKRGMLWRGVVDWRTAPAVALVVHRVDSVPSICHFLCERVVAIAVLPEA